MNKSYSLSIVMPTCDRGEVFETAKKSVLDTIGGKNVEYLVINDSKESKIILSEEESKNMRVIDNPKSGVASARNLGASLVSSDYILFLDDDMFLRPENLEDIFNQIETADMDKLCFNINWVYPPRLREAIEKTKFGRFLIKYGFDTLNGWNNFPVWPEKSFFEIEGLISNCLTISKDNFNRIGGYNENFPHAGFEDDDFSKRAAEQIKIFLSTKSLLWHNESDRVEPQAWLARKERGGETRKVAVDLGRKELELNFSPIKKKIYSTVNQFKISFLKVLEMLPNSKLIDPIYFKGIKLLLGTATYIGYTKNEQK